MRVIRGMSEKLIVAVVIRGIKDPQVRAAATCANLSSEGLVKFLSLYTKPLEPRSIIQNHVKRPNLRDNFGKRDNFQSNINCSCFM